MKIAYFGTPEISAHLLKKLIENNISISYVATQPDRPVGKRLSMTPSPVKRLCLSQDIEYFDKPLMKSTSQELSNILKDKQIDLCILFAYGQLIGPVLLDSTRYGFWNIHPSLLPRYRGASPTVYPVLLGEYTTGVTLMQMNAGLDEGDIIMQESFDINKDMMRKDIEEESIEIAATQIKSGINNIETLRHTQQDPQLATYTRKISKSDGYVDFFYIEQALLGKKYYEQLPSIIEDYYHDNNLFSPEDRTPAVIIHQMFRALSPWPGIWTKIPIKGSEKRLKLSILHTEGYKLIIDKVQLEGKVETDFIPFNKAYNVFNI